LTILLKLNSLCSIILTAFHFTGDEDMDSNKRSLAKALSWRMLATLITTAIVFALTGKGEFAATIGVADTLVKFFIYFGHERLWNRIPYGRKKQEPEYYI
jgi:uncharacterized membrane protein